MSHRRAAILPVLPLALLLGAAAPQPRGHFEGTTNVLEVQVPVQVVLNGEPVRGLSEKNFEVYEGRHRQRLTGFDVVDLREVKSATPPPSVLPPAARRRFLLLFDLTFSEPSSILRAREAAMKLVHDEMNPSDLVGVATYSLNRGPHLVLNFTTDRIQVDEAIQTLDLPKLASEPPDPLRLMIEAERPGQVLSLGGNRGAGPGADALAQAKAAIYKRLVDMQHQKQQATRQTESNEAIAFSQALADMAKSLAAVPGRKYVLFLSEGFSGDVLTGGKIEEETHQNIERGQNWKVDTSQMFGNSRVQNNVEKMIDTFRRSDCVIEAIDIGGLRAANAERQRPHGDSSLFLMANDTGGELFQHYNDLGSAMKQMLDRTSVLYLLSFSPQRIKPDGSYHRIRVKLIDAPSGARLVARPGYYAPTRYASMNPAEQQLENAGMIMGGQEGGQLPVSILAAPFPLRGTQEKAYVPVLIEVNGKSLLRGVSKPEAVCQIYVYALDGQGTIRDFRVQALKVNVDQIGKVIEKSGLKFFGHLDLGPGSYSLRILVRNAETGEAAVRDVQLNVPKFGQTGPILLRPLFPETPGKWVMVREAVRGEADKTVPYPFMLGEQPFIPASRPVVAPGGELPVYLVGYHLPSSKPDLHAVVIREDGSTISGAEISLSGPAQSSNSRAQAIPATLKVRNLAPGSYELRVELRGGAGKVDSPPAAFVVAGS